MLTNKYITSPLLRHALADLTNSLRNTTNREISRGDRDGRWHHAKGWWKHGAHLMAQDLSFRLPPLPCGKSERQHGILKACAKPLGHTGKCHFSRVVGITIEWEDVSDDAIDNLADELNDGERHQYTEEQIKRALWLALGDRIERLVENIEDLQKDREFERQLGEPTIDRQEEVRLAYADYVYDVSRGK